MWHAVTKCIMDLSVCSRRRETVDMCEYTSLSLSSSLPLSLSLSIFLPLPPSLPPPLCPSLSPYHFPYTFLSLPSSTGQQYDYYVAVTLSLFLGMLGIDRFYLGYPAIGEWAFPFSVIEWCFFDIARGGGGDKLLRVDYASCKTFSPKTFISMLSLVVLVMIYARSPPLSHTHRSNEAVYIWFLSHWPSNWLSPDPDSSGWPVRPVWLLCSFLWPPSVTSQHHRPLPTSSRGGNSITTLIKIYFLTVSPFCVCMHVEYSWLV